MDFLGKCKSLEYQFDLFVKFTAVFNGIKNQAQRNENLLDLSTLNQIALILDTMCFQSHYIVRVNDTNQKYILKSELEIVK